MDGGWVRKHWDFLMFAPSIPAEGSFTTLQGNTPRAFQGIPGE